MKKLTSMLGLLAVAAGLTAAVAMAPAPEKSTVKSNTTVSNYWFDLNGNRLNLTPEEIQAQCGTEEVLCAKGYDAIDGAGNPSGPQTGSILGEQN
ncbi:hypothetical protein A0O34_07120 [Chryseobacterium glaciei]|uniref:Uncharacterized protein n=1 Tax=Chryseobacterium glaciei TaxID=1685010 RepID=A0A172XTU6_9FLAO|nr:hypothetical protein [Chryseobacterium glaciei]ANF50300.1 hypothetical protein A0O34_07120 [Chryseobacterium glaciei]